MICNLHIQPPFFVLNCLQIRIKRLPPSPFTQHLQVSIHHKWASRICCIFCEQWAKLTYLYVNLANAARVRYLYLTSRCAFPLKYCVCRNVYIYTSQHITSFPYILAVSIRRYPSRSARYTEFSASFPSSRKSSLPAFPYCLPSHNGSLHWNSLHPPLNKTLLILPWHISPATIFYLLPSILFAFCATWGYIWNASATSFRFSTIGKCCGQWSSHCLHPIQSSGFPWVAVRFPYVVASPANSPNCFWLLYREKYSGMAIFFGQPEVQ